MKVTLEHTTTKVGIFKSAPVIKLTVEFSNEEKEVIKKSGLKDYAYYTKPITKRINASMQGSFLVKYLVDGKPNFMVYDDEATARAEEPKLKEALKNLKASIESNAQPFNKKESFEL